jgi:protein-S-isoprenylcysteine O-methyltransferase Ste14
MDSATIRRVWLPLALALIAIGYMYKVAPGPHDWARLLGLVLALMGLAGVIVSRYTLGRSFSIVPKATALVTTGIYSRIRNPIYVSGMFFLAGLVLIIRKPAMLAFALVLIPIQIVRARREAAVLEAQFGDAYREYRKRTWF